MKQLFYFILLLAGFSSVHSCKDLLDDDGNPLVDLNNTGGLIGPRALYREITDADTIAEYQYNGLLLSRVISRGVAVGKPKSITDIMYSGEKVSKINFNGYLDLDDNGIIDTDSVSYTQLFTYGNSGRLETISENRSIYRRPPVILPGTPPNPMALLRKSKTLYNLGYSTATAKLETITMQNGPDASGIPFAFTDYSKTTYTYLGDNISKAERNYGPMTGGVFGTATERYGYDFAIYDSQISPFTLLPMAYKISRLLSTERNDAESFILSPNSPKRLSASDLTLPIPAPVIQTTNYSYDPQTYMTKGLGVNYIYKPL
jgi:hypothetical protein